jgi:hypothetical protein
MFRLILWAVIFCAGMYTGYKMKDETSVQVGAKVIDKMATQVQSTIDSAREEVEKNPPSVK